MSADWAKFWDDVHTGKLSDFWLTNTPPQDYIENMGLEIEPPMSVLEIGPGKGLMIQYLVDLGCRVGACDLSSEGLSRLPDSVDKIILSELPNVPTGRFDLGLCYLTLQHVDDDMLQFILNHGVRVCKTFKFQFAELVIPEIGVTGYSKEHAGDGPLYFRSLSKVRAMCPHNSFNLNKTIHHSGQNIMWRFVTVHA